MTDIIHLVWQYFLPFVVVLTIVVFVHEFGHYWIARRSGVKIETFSIGFGPEIFGRTDKHGTRWKISAIPLGGYVKMFGDADPASSPDPKVREMTEAEKKISFFHQNVRTRAAIVFAGPAANYVFAVLVLALLFVFTGQPFTSSEVGGLAEDGPAAKAGLQIGDRVVAIDGESTERFEDIQRIVSLNTGTPVVVSVLREGERRDVTVTPRITEMTDRFGGTHKVGRIGLQSHQIEIRQLAPLEAVKAAFVETWTISVSTLQAVGQMIMGMRSTEELGGALRIAKMSGDISKEKSIPSFFWFIAMISINLGLVNLFPIPMLDGGHLAFNAMEGLRGRPMSDKIQEIGARVGMTLVLSLMLFATWNDLVHLRVIAYIKNLFS